MKTICNASPLIVLAKAGLIEFLPRQFSRIYVPNAVWKEILAGSRDDPMRMMLDELPWLERVHLSPPLSPLACWGLGCGESEVIEYARLHPGAVALIDDRSARRAAEALNIKVYGTLSIIARQVNRDPSISFDESVKRLKEAGLYLNDQLIKNVREKLEI